MSCICPHGIRPLGRLYGVDMGRGKIRLSTVPDCPVHGNCSNCGSSEWRCYKKRWAKGFAKMLDPCCVECSHLVRRDAGKR